MTRARKRGRVGRRLARVGRALLAAGLLATLGWAAFQGVHRSADASDAGRRADRLEVTRAAAAGATAWLQAGLDEAAAVAAGAGTHGAGSAVESYAAGTHQFREALVVDRTLHLQAGNLRYAASDGVLIPCRRTDAPPENGLAELVQTAFQGPGPVMRAFDDPSCKPVVAAAAPAGAGAVAVVLADPAALAARLDTLARLANARAVFADPTGAMIGADGTLVPFQGTPPGGASGQSGDDLPPFLANHRQHDGVVDVGGVVRAWVPLPGGWAIAVDQGAQDFSGSSVTQPSAWIPAAVAACFGFAIVIVGVFDARRRKALARAEEVRSSFLAVVSHELRTPLTVLKGFVDTLLARWGHMDDTQRQSLVERLAPQVRRLHRGVDRLLVAADIQRGANLRIGRESLELARVVADVVDGFRALAPLHTFVVDVAPEITVIGDDKALAQALDQLVDNAIKYSPAGGAVSVRAHARAGARRVVLTVDDEGVGLPSDFSRIFEPLTQGEDVDSRVHDEGGVGVGLYIARAMVDAMGGSVRAERRASGPGTRVIVTLVAGPSHPAGGESLARTSRVHGSF
ncbi:MAG: hypothetical protein JO265_09245 [Acidimicrobiia bacterium]|nr:hypothetical protein [Acidimicrobiia bacterium]